MGQTKRPNPFPMTGVFSLQGTSFLKEPPSWVTSHPSYPLPALQELQKVVDAYFKRFRRSERDSLGKSYMLKGDPGTGKTHALGKVLFKKPDTTSAPRPLILYAKATGPSFTKLFVELMSDFKCDEGLTLLREVGSKSLETLLSERRGGRPFDKKSGFSPYLRQEQPPKSDSSDSTQSEVPTSLETLGTTAGKLQFLSDVRVMPAELWAQQAHILDSKAERRAEFANAFEYLFSAELGRDVRLASVARDWLVGSAIDAVDRAKLGISRSIETPEDALAAVYFLATLFGQAGRPLVLAIDQCEKLFFKASREEKGVARGILHSLLEVVPREGGLLLLAGTGKAWNEFSDDLKDRIAEVIPFPRVTPKEAEGVLIVYLDAAKQDGGTVAAASDDRAHRLLPFTRAAIRSLLARSSGRLRPLLQMAHDAYERTKPNKKIGSRRIAALTAKPGRELVTEDSIVKAIEPLLSQRGLHFKTLGTNMPPGDGHLPRLVVGNDNIERAAVQISRAVFTVDEAWQAVRIAQTVQALNARTAPIPLIVVYAGYASPKVLVKISKATRVVVYEPQTFAEVMGQELDRVKGAVAAESIASSTTPENKIVLNVQNLQHRAEAEEERAAQIQNKLDDLGRREFEARLAQRRREAQTEWANEESRLLDQIKTGRIDRAKTEMDELERYRKSAEDERRRQGRIVNGTLCIFGAAIAVIAGLFAWSIYEQQQPIVDRSPYGAGAMPVDKITTENFLVCPKIELSDSLHYRIADEQQYLQYPFAAATGSVTDTNNDESKLKSKLSSIQSDASKMIETINVRIDALSKRAQATLPRDTLSTRQLEREVWDAERFDKLELEKNIYLTIGMIALLIPVAWVTFVLRQKFAPPSISDRLASPIERPTELERLARQWIGAGGPHRRSSLQRLQQVFSLRWRHRRSDNPLEDPNPHLRYAAALALGDRPTSANTSGDQAASAPQPTTGNHETIDNSDPAKLITILRGEPTAIVRRALSTAIGRTCDVGFTQIDELSEEIPEVVYLIESIIRRRSQPLGGVNLRLQLVCRMTLIDRVDERELSESIRDLFGSLNIDGTPKQKLSDAYRTGREPSDLSFLEDLPEARLRTAIKAVSPEERGGLGTFDYLRVIGRIDDLYLLLRRAQFYKRRSLLLLSASDGPLNE